MANVKGMKTLPPANRLQGSLPKIGIRPAIDGRRRGVRESLEGQTMGMAKSVAELITRSIRHPCGLPVECVIADTCIGGVAEAARDRGEVPPRRGGRFHHGHSLLVLRRGNHGHGSARRPRPSGASTARSGPGPCTLPPCWPPMPRRACPRSGSTAATCRTPADTKIPADVQEKLLQFARAGLAAASMRGTSYLAMGAVSMGIAGSIVDPRFLESWLGMRYEMIDMSEFTRRIDEKIYDPGRVHARPRLGEAELQGRAGPQPRRQSSARAPRRTPTGSSW